MKKLLDRFRKALTRRRLAGAGVALVLVAALSACGDTDPNRGNTEKKARETTEELQDSIVTGQQRRVDSQPVPVFDYSQEFQTLLDLMAFRATGTHGTYYLRNLAGEIVEWCPTQGAPIPSTYQSTPGQQYVDVKGDDSRAMYPVDLAEPTGVYPGESSATWVLCLDDNGKPFPLYFEPAGQWIGAERSDLPAQLRVRADEVTYRFATNEDEAQANYDALCEDKVITDCD